MTFTKSLKQFVRTPLTASVFLVMFAIASFFVSCGAIIWARNQAVIKAYEDVFVTIGTVRQLPTRIDIVDTWDADMKDYRRASRARYSSPIPVSVLDFDGADYIYRSEKRPFYGAWRPDLKLYLGQGETKSSYMSNFVVEVAPLEDCVPSGPVQVRIERVLFTELLFNQFEELQPGEVIYLCDHNNDAPQPLYADRTYLMVLIRGAAHASGGKREFHPETITFSTQYRPDGTLVSGEAIVRSILEVNKDATDEMRLWLNYAANMNNAAYTIPVLPTAATHLLIPFYNGSAFMVEGEDITAEEYEDGARVCLISENFASMNGIGVGDMLRLPLYYADYRYAPSDMFLDTFSLSKTVGGIFRWYMGPPLNAAGEPYGVFSDHEYVVKGVYSGDHTRENSDALGANTVVVPAASIRESDTDNITEFGPMKHSTTTFEIPNGSIDSFMENWLKTGREDLEFEFYDRGYTQLQRGLVNMKRMSLLFLAIGAAMALSLVFYFCYVFISGNRMRTAIERLLGYAKSQCVVSLLSGFLLAATLAVAIGCTASVFAEGRVSELIAGEEYYDLSFTVGPRDQEDFEVDADVDPTVVSVGTALLLLVIAASISSAFVRANVRKEPLLLLSSKSE